MCTVELEPTLVAKPPLKAVREFGRSIDNVAAVVADDMDVVVLGGTVCRCAMVQMGVPHHPDLLEELERAVDRRQVDIIDGVEDLFGRGVAEMADSCEHALALSGHA